MTHSRQPDERPRPVVLCILDGWGERAETDNNAVALGSTPNWDRMVRQWPSGTLDASGPDVGLPDGQMGNSEVGHLNIGAGRVVWQELPRINQAVEDGTLAASPVLAEFVAGLKASGGRCHLMGLVSPGGVHAHQTHISALAEALGGAGIDVVVHAFLDGRDTPPQSAADSVAEFAAALGHVPGAAIGTVIGRYFAMDRDKRWPRVERAYRAIVMGEGTRADDPVAAIEESYARKVGDEFVEPVVLGDYSGMADGDGLLMANFRADRARQLLTALVDPDFEGFAREKVVSFGARAGMVSYSEALDPYFSALFPPSLIDGSLGEVLARRGLRQLRLAETEKYPHVTFFFSGGREQPFEGEDRHLVPSPQVATYDLQPQMSAAEVTEKLLEAIAARQYDFILINYANGDMVGHTGVLEAAITAVETLDSCLGRVEEAILAADGVMLVTADHGNCELMVDPATGGPHTAHTMNPVPTVLVNGPKWVQDCEPALAHGRLADLAPTILRLLAIAQPAAMTGQSIVLTRESEPIAAG